MGITAAPRLLHCQTVGDWLTLLQEKSVQYSPENNCLSDEQQMSLISLVLQGFVPFHVSYASFQNKIIVLHGAVELTTLSNFAVCDIENNRCLFCDLPSAMQKRMLYAPVPSSGCYLDSEKDLQSLLDYYNKTVDAIP